MGKQYFILDFAAFDEYALPLVDAMHCINVVHAKLSAISCYPMFV